MAFEIGPIRPPSEARSLLVRVTRNCPHNRCAFCPVYRGSRFSIRKVADVQRDIEQMGTVAEQLREHSRRLGAAGEISLEVIRAAAAEGGLSSAEIQVALFLASGSERVFLQDANSLVMPADDLVQILQTLRATFPTIRRITTYARSHTLSRRSVEQLTALRQAGLNRVHVGLESGSDRVLQLVSKGVDAARQIEAGLRAKAAGMELSEYVMPGLGGRALSAEHARQSARVLSEIDPHFIRLRTTAIAPGTELEQLANSGAIDPMSDEEVVTEIRLFIENLQVSSMLHSDHVLNLLGELEGRLPDDKQRMLEIIDRFLALDQTLRRVFVVGRRAGLLTVLDDLAVSPLREHAQRLLDQIGDHYGNDLDQAIRDLMIKFI